MIDKEKREYLINDLNLDCALFENPAFDASIIGVTTSGHIVYDFDYMVEELKTDEDMTEMEAVDYIEYNTVRTLSYIEADIRPIVIHRLVI